MKNGTLKKMLALTLSGTMMLGMSSVALASETTSSGTGTGEVEGYVDEKVVLVKLPTTEAVADAFSYIMDPQGLLNSTEGAARNAATFEDGATVYFKTGDNSYAGTSKKLKAINIGTVAADVTVAAEIAYSTEVTAVADKTGFTANNTSPQLYLDLNTTQQKAATVIGQDADGDDDDVTAKVTLGIAGNKANYEYKYANNTYSFGAKDGVAETAWNCCEYWLTGACNPYGVYGAESQGAMNVIDAPQVELTWSYVERTGETATLLTENKEEGPVDAAPSIATTSYTLTAGTELEVEVDLGAGNLAATGVSQLLMGSIDQISGGYASYSDGKITVSSGTVDYLRGTSGADTFTVVFDDAAGTRIDITLN